MTNLTIKTNANKNYLNFLKHAEKVTQTVGNERLVLKNACLETDGSIVVTDVKRLYKFKNTHHEAYRKMVDVKTFETVETKFVYPDTSRLIPHKDNATASVKIGDSLKTITETLVNKNKSDVCTVAIVNEKLYLEKELLGYAPNAENLKMNFTTTHLLEAFEMFDEMTHKITVEYHNVGLVIYSEDITAFIFSLR